MNANSAGRSTAIIVALIGVLTFAIYIAAYAVQTASAASDVALRDNYFPNTETLGTSEMRVIALGTGTPNFRRSQASAAWLVELGNGDKFIFDIGTGSLANLAALGVSPEPTSLTDAYALIKVLSKEYGETHFRLLVNLVGSGHDAIAVYRRLCRATDRFLNVSIDYAGWIPLDDYLPLAVQQQRAVLDLFPQAPSSRAFQRLARTVASWDTTRAPKGGMQFYWQRLVTQA